MGLLLMVVLRLARVESSAKFVRTPRYCHHVWKRTDLSYSRLISVAVNCVLGFSMNAEVSASLDECYRSIFDLILEL